MLAMFTDGCTPESMSMYDLTQVDIKPDINQLQAQQQMNGGVAVDTTSRLYDYQSQYMMNGAMHSPMSVASAGSFDIAL